MKVDENDDVLPEIVVGEIRLCLDRFDRQGYLTISPRRTLVADERYGLLPDLGPLELRRADSVGHHSLTDLAVPMWQGDALWLDFTTTTDESVDVFVSLDDGPETLCSVPFDPWIDRLRRPDGSSVQPMAPPGGTSRLTISVSGSAVTEQRVSLHLVDAAVWVHAGLGVPSHAPLEPIDYADHNVPWPVAPRQRSNER
ncbi:hypothetical protein [Williamsia sp. M5A3_1d]